MNPPPVALEALVMALRPIFPPDCAVAAERLTATLDGLYPAEAASVIHAVPKRQGEFAAGRIAARRALADIGRPGVEIPVGADRAPRWPAGTIGSISHAGDVAVAVVAATTTTAALGIDVEIDGALHVDLWPTVLSANERQAVLARPVAEQRRWATTMFSAKEAFYKFQHPLTRRWLDFNDVEVRLEAETFTVRVLRPPVPILEGLFLGRQLQLPGLILTALHRAR